MLELGKKFIITAANVDWYIDKMGEWIRQMADGHGIILGLSGGVDSAVTARLAQEAGVDLKVLLLPEGEASLGSANFNDAVKLVKLYGINYEVIDIKPVCAATKVAGLRALDVEADAENQRLALINIAPRVRANLLYLVGQQEGRRVIGTDNLAEQVTGYFTKWGDGAYDFCPLTYCTKGEVYILAKALGVVDEIIAKAPSADLEDGQTDEGELGYTYAQIDAWILYGASGDSDVDAKIEARYRATAHKRCLPYAFE
jgi:NAD+ synthase